MPLFACAGLYAGTALALKTAMRFFYPLVVAVIAAAPMPALAQEGRHVLPNSGLVISDRAIAEGLKAAPATQANQRDSVKDGMIIGGLVGAMVMGTGVGLLCKALQEPSDPSCWKAVGVGGLYGAGIGLAVGAGIDALFARKPQPFLRR